MKIRLFFAGVIVTGVAFLMRKAIEGLFEDFCKSLEE